VRDRVQQHIEETGRDQSSGQVNSGGNDLEVEGYGDRSLGGGTATRCGHSMAPIWLVGTP
jgi:hypothetical protein